MNEENNTRASMQQKYRDYSGVTEVAPDTPKDDKNKKEHNFPVRLQYVLREMEKDGLEDVISWQPHGRAFMVRDTKRFEKQYLPLWFRQTKIASFLRQLNIYEFTRITSGIDKGCYYHELFLRGKSFLAQKIQRRKTGPAGRRDHVDKAPNLYSLPYLPLHEDIVEKTSTPSVQSPANQQPCSPRGAVAGTVLRDSALAVASSSGPRLQPLPERRELSTGAAEVATVLTNGNNLLQLSPFGAASSTGRVNVLQHRLPEASSVFPSSLFQGVAPCPYSPGLRLERQPSLLSMGTRGDSDLLLLAALERMGYAP